MTNAHAPIPRPGPRPVWQVLLAAEVLAIPMAVPVGLIAAGWAVYCAQRLAGEDDADALGSFWSFGIWWVVPWAIPVAFVLCLAAGAVAASATLPLRMRAFTIGGRAMRLAFPGVYAAVVAVAGIALSAVMIASSIVTAAQLEAAGLGGVADPSDFELLPVVWLIGPLLDAAVAGLGAWLLARFFLAPPRRDPARRQAADVPPLLRAR